MGSASVAVGVGDAVVAGVLGCHFLRSGVAAADGGWASTSFVAST